MSSPFMQPPTTTGYDPQPGDIVGGRYFLPHPETGAAHKWMRTTNFIEKISDVFSIREWEKQTLVAGLVLREDYYAQACGALEFSPGTQDLTKDSKKKINEVIELAHEAGGGNTGARLGTALHSYTEAAKRGQEIRAPKKWQGKVQLYLDTLTANGLTYRPELLERRVVCLKYNLAGTFDDGLQTRDHRLVIGDTKSQKKIYSYCSPAMQFSVYANADAMWNPTTGTYEDMPPFDKDVALQIWVPARGDHDGVCEVHWVDIKQGWEAVELAHQVYEWQKAGKRKNEVGGLYVAPSSLSMTEAYARRILDAESVEELGRIWEEATAAGVWCPALEEAGQGRKWLLIQHPEIAADLVSTVDNVSTVN